MCLLLFSHQGCSCEWVSSRSCSYRVYILVGERGQIDIVHAVISVKEKEMNQNKRTEWCQGPLLEAHQQRPVWWVLSEPRSDEIMEGSSHEVTGNDCSGQGTASAKALPQATLGNIRKHRTARRPVRKEWNNQWGECMNSIPEGAIGSHPVGLVRYGISLWVRCKATRGFWAEVWL